MKEAIDKLQGLGSYVAKMKDNVEYERDGSVRINIEKVLDTCLGQLENIYTILINHRDEASQPKKEEEQE